MFYHRIAKSSKPSHKCEPHSGVDKIACCSLGYRIPVFHRLWLLQRHKVRMSPIGVGGSDIFIFKYS